MAVAGVSAPSLNTMRPCSASLPERTPWRSLLIIPEHPFPAAIEDAVTALKWTAAQRSDFGAADAPIFVGGDSAGGNISAAISILSRDELKVPIAGQILLYPSVDLDIDHERMDAFVPPLLTKAECDWFVTQYVPNKADRSSPQEGTKPC